MRLRCILTLLLLAPCSVSPAQVSDGGGRDVSVALFSTHDVQALSVTPLEQGAWVARCASCARIPLTKQLSSTSGMDIYLGGTLRVTDAATKESRTANGLWHIRSNHAGGAVDVVLTLPSERYVAAVLNAEAAKGELAQSLQAMAVVVRTYGLNGKHYTAQAGHLRAELCDSTQCQAMLLQTPTQAIEDAVRSTAGETLWFGPKRAEVYFSQNCGGMTEDAGAVWPSLRGKPYLQSHVDPYCLRRPSSAWHAEVPMASFAAIAQRERWHVPADLVWVQVTKRSRSHRAVLIGFIGRDGAKATLAASAMRFGIGRALGWNRVRSDDYELGLRNGALIFDGRGHGHGVGLCQAGASEMASEGKSIREILAFYFPGTYISITGGDRGWQQSTAGPLVVRSTLEIGATQQERFEQLWKDAQRRFPPAHAVTPTLVLAPTTELFRQLTSQPGWALASTQGATIVLQPESVFKSQERPMTETMLHEMLHVVVESACNERTPLWLREGLVEVLANDVSRPATSLSSSLSTRQIEDELQHADSLKLSEQAHVAAAAKVRLLIVRYGASTVRGWLSSGVPAGVS